MKAGFTIGSGSSASSTPTLGISATDAVKSEGNSGPTPFTFTVNSRRRHQSGSTTVKDTVSGSGGDPANAQDFTGKVFPLGTITFNPGESSKTVTINVNGDTDVEADEGFTVTLSNRPVAPRSTLAVPTASSATTIRPQVVRLDGFHWRRADKDEGNSGPTMFTFTVGRGNDTSGTTAVDFTVTGSGVNPATGADFGGVLPSGKVTFTDGETSKTVDRQRKR